MSAKPAYIAAMRRLREQAPRIAAAIEAEVARGRRESARTRRKLRDLETQLAAREAERTAPPTATIRADQADYAALFNDGQQL